MIEKYLNGLPKSFVIYGVSSSIGKASALLALPFLISYLTISEIGIYSLTQTIVILLVPFFCANGGVGIIREGALDPATGTLIFKKYFTYTLMYGLLSLVIASTWLHTHQLVSYILCLVVTEALLNLYFSWLRAINAECSFFLINTFKSILFLIVVILGKDKFHIMDVFLSQIICNSIFLGGSVVLYFKLSPLNELNRNKPIPKTLIYSLLLIPHGIAQWVNSSSNRLIIDCLMGESAVGLYSLAYSMALILVLLNNGISLALPPFIIKNYQLWVGTSLRKNYIYLYNVITSLVYVFILLVCFIYLKPSSSITSIKMVFYSFGFVASGVYWLGLYYFYGNIYFYKKKTGLLAFQTVCCAIYNIILTIYFIIFYGVLGAAIASLLSYVINLIVVIRGAIKLEPAIKQDIFLDLKWTPIITIMFISCPYFLCKSF